MGQGRCRIRAVWGCGGEYPPVLRRVPGAAYSQSAEGRTGKHPGLSFLGREPSPTGAVARLARPLWERTPPLATGRLRGWYRQKPLPTYPQGFPQEVLEAFEAATGRGVLCNRPYSGTDVIRDYGAEQLKTGKWIVYTSADSVFQIAAHEAHPPGGAVCGLPQGPEILRGKHGVGRVIARPYVGSPETGFTRTANRHDFSLEPPEIHFWMC